MALTTDVTGIKIEHESDDVRVPESSVHVQFVNATVARQPNPFDGHRAGRSTAAVQQHRPVNGAERADVQHRDVRESPPDRGRSDGVSNLLRHSRDVAARSAHGRPLRTVRRMVTPTAAAVHDRPRITLHGGARNKFR